MSPETTGETLRAYREALALLAPPKRCVACRMAIRPVLLAHSEAEICGFCADGPDACAECGEVDGIHTVTCGFLDPQDDSAEREADRARDVSR